MNETEHFRPYSKELVNVGLLLLCILFLFLGGFILHQEYEKQSLGKQLELLEISLEQQRESNVQQLDSLQRSLLVHRVLNQHLRDSIVLLKQKRKELKRRADENKAAIIRIRDLDSLRDEVARNYSRS